MADTITTAAPTVSPPATSIQHQATADLTGRPPARPIHLVQYDQTLPVLAVELTYAGQPYVLPTGAAVNIRMDKRDGHYVYNPALGVDTSRTVAYIVVTQQMTTNAGEYKPILEVVVNGGVAGTAPIAVYIDRNPVPEDVIASTDEYKTIEQLAAEVTAAAQIISDNEAAIQEIHDNLPAIQGAASNATTAQTAAQQAKEYAESIDPSILDILTGGAIIPNAADLNDYKKVGVYHCSSAGNAATIVNNPNTGSAFALKVSKPGAESKSSTTASIRQDIIPANASTIQYTRRYLVSSASWSDWLECATASKVEAATSISYTVTVPASTWATGSLTYLGQTYTKKAAITASAATGTAKGLIVEPTAGSAADLQAWGVLDVTAGTVTLWSKTALTGSITLKITEVR